MTKAALIILDGFGLRNETFGNAIAQAKKPNFDRLWQEYPTTTLVASGEAVGLPDGQMGNSEVGHLNIGAGRIVYQSLTKIDIAIRDGSIRKNKEILAAFEHVRKMNSKLHFFGLVSDGGVHSHVNHLLELIQMAKDNDINKVLVHAFLDGRDVGPKSASTYLQQVEDTCHDLGIGTIATVSGRYYAMDRDQRWDRVEKVVRALVNGEGKEYQHYTEIMNESYASGITDEFVIPSLVKSKNSFSNKVEENDAIIFFNFRPDRAIQLSRVFTDDEFQPFQEKIVIPKNLFFVSMTHYSDDVKAHVAFESVNLNDTIGEVLSKHHLRQLRIAETEKYPHVTFFMSGGSEEPFPLENRILINSPKVATYDLKPEMSAFEVTERLIQEIKSNQTDVILLNFANPDMVGHSGMLEPTIRAIEVVDECLGEIVNALEEQGAVAIITADHGNADEVVTLDGEPMTAHTTNPVPVIVTKKGITLKSGILADLSPTLLDLLGIQQPEAMTGKSLIVK